MEKRYVLQDVEVYPRQPTETFQIDYLDVLPIAKVQSANGADLFATIPLSLFHDSAYQAAFNAQGEEESSGDCDSGQEPTPAIPTGSGSLDDDGNQSVNAAEASRL